MLSFNSELAAVPRGSSIALLCSGGVDSAILLCLLTDAGYRMQPLYLRHGLRWEEAEHEALRRFLGAIKQPHIAPLRVLEMPVSDLYGDHWSTSGDNVPDQHSDDAAVYLPGRNLLMLAKAGVWCATNDVQYIALAPLKANPFSDNSEAFYQAMRSAITVAVGQDLRILRPFASLTKAEILQQGASLPLHLSFSCIRPQNKKHCGVCNKCAERKEAFGEAGITDRTDYVWGQEVQSCMK